MQNTRDIGVMFQNKSSMTFKMKAKITYNLNNSRYHLRKEQTGIKSIHCTEPYISTGYPRNPITRVLCGVEKYIREKKSVYENKTNLLN